MSSELADVIASELARHAPDLGSTEIAAMTASACAAGAYVMRDGKLSPGAPQAIAQCAHFLPKQFVRAMATRAMEAAPTQAAAVTAYVRALGARDFDAAIEGGTGFSAGERAEMDRLVGEQTHGSK